MAATLKQLGMAAACFALGILAAPFAAEPVTAVHADEKKAPEAFLSGGARSEKVLVEILTTLRQMDSRVAEIEEILKSSDGSKVPKTKSEQ